MDGEQPASQTRSRTARAAVLAAAMLMLVVVAAVLLSADGGRSALVESSQDLVIALLPTPLRVKVQ
jgi:hypothetical protein